MQQHKTVLAAESSEHKVYTVSNCKVQITSKSCWQSPINLRRGVCGATEEGSIARCSAQGFAGHGLCHQAGNTRPASSVYTI